jgi:hypothetical protein
LIQNALLALVLAFEAGLLLVGAQTGFLDGPAVLSNMACDYWVPRHFRDLSARLVRQNGIIVMGVASLLILLWTHGDVSVLVVLYSINVFLTFSLSLFGLCIYWWRHRQEARIWRRRLLLSAMGFAVTATVLVITLFEKFMAGGWLTVVVTSAVIGLCLLIKRHYVETRQHLAQADAVYSADPDSIAEGAALSIDPKQPTAIVLVGRHRGVSMHALVWVQRLFPHYKNFIFLAVGEVDAQSYEGQQQLRRLQEKIETSLKYYVSYCHTQGIPAESRMAFGTDPGMEFIKLAEKTMEQCPASVCFATKLIFSRANFLTVWLHNQTPLFIQRRLHLKGKQMVLLPMRVG